MLVFGGAKGCSDEDFVSGGASVGRSAPLHPLGDGMREGCDPLALSRGLLRREFRFPTMQETASVEMLVFGSAKGCSDEDFVSDDAGRGALRSPTPPRVTGCERVATLSRSPGAGLAGISVSDDSGNGFGGDSGFRRREGLFG